MRFSTGLLVVVCGGMWLAGCQNFPATPISSDDRDQPSDPKPRAELFQPEFRGSPFYTDLSPETDGSAGGDYDVDVSPDGKQLVFASTRYTTQPKVFVKDLESGAVYQKSSGPGRDIQPKFSPDGKWIAFSSNRDGNYNLLLVPADRNEAYWQLTHSDADEIHPTWSPDGKRVAYSAREQGGEWNLWIIEVEGQRRTQLGPGLYPEWSPDGEHLAFQRPSRRGQGWYGIWIVPATGGAPREVATDPDVGFIQPAWSPNSARLVYGTVSSALERADAPPRAQDLWVVELDTGNRVRLTQADAEDYAPAWGLDGRIYFTSQRGGQARVWSLMPAASPRRMDMDQERFPKEVRR